MSRLILVVIFLVLTSCSQVFGQQNNRIQPGKRYAAGESIYAPLYGFAATIPEGWEGLLPRESEVFLLTSTTSAYGEVFVFGRDKVDLEVLKKNWGSGFELSESIKLKAIDPTIEGDLLLSKVEAEGEYINKGFQQYAVAKCKPNGPCIISLMNAPVQYYEAVKNITIDFMRSSAFEERAKTSPYSDFVWSEFLSNKVLMTFTSVQSGSKESFIHLCADGTFQADLKKKGIFKNQNSQYRGRNSGQWSVKGIGSESEITFEFDDKKLASITAPLLIQEDNVFSDGERYFVGQSDRCK